LKQSQYELVQNKTRKLLELMPSDEESYLSLARAFKGQGKHEDAMQVLNALLQVNPGCGPACVMQGQLYLSQGLLLDADEKFRVASQLFEGDTVLYYGWGKTLGLLGLHELALEKFEKANEIDPFDADTYEAWGATLKILGRYQEAAEIYRKAAEYI
jgi:tetratricopeptide (TPR) repeat protein